MKNKETLEEAAERITTNNFSPATNKFTKINIFKEGAKWQMERSYSEEEVLEILGSYAEWSINGNCNYYEWLEQFKNK